MVYYTSNMLETCIHHEYSAWDTAKDKH